MSVALETAVSPDARGSELGQASKGDGITGLDKA